MIDLSLGRKLFAGVLFMATLPARAQIADTQIWSDQKGFVPAPFCQLSDSPQTVHPKMNAYIHQPFELADGSIWQAVREDERLITLDCLLEQKLKNYILFETKRGSDSPSLVGVQPGEVAIFASHQPQPALMQKMSANSSSAPLDLPAGVEAFDGTLDYVVCITGSSLNVRDQALAKVLFTVPRHAIAKPVQSFGTDKLKKTIGGTEYIFIKSEFPAATGALKIGWVAESYIKPRAQCAGAQPAPAPVPREETPAAAWTFPTIKRATDNYKEGMRRFRASRSGGRLHAACDIYRVVNEQAVAVTAGTVVRDRYYFYQGTYAIEIKHTGGKVARYGEITGTAAPNVGVNKAVKAGQPIGYIGKVNSNCCKPMLHFELYSGTASGSLTQSGNSFNRRKDLLDPSQLLTEWEKIKFGTSY